MAIELKQSLKMSQQLVITPQLQQAIKMLQLSRMDLASTIREELLENPVLEEIEQDDIPEKSQASDENKKEANDTTSQEEAGGDQNKEPTDFDWENYIGNMNSPGYEARQSYNPDESSSFESYTSKAESLKDHLEWQFRMAQKSKLEEEIGSVLLNYVEDDGYVKVPLNDIAAKHDFSEEDCELALEFIQTLDPIGVGARDLKECLLIQAEQFSEKKHLNEIIHNHLDLISRRDYQTLARKMKLSLKKILDLASIIGTMEPKPGRPFIESNTQYIVPDVYVYKSGDDYMVVLNEEGLPRLKVSPFYRQMVIHKNEAAPEPQKESAEGGAKQYINDKLKNAMWLIKSIHQRHRTIYRVAKCIIQFQREFLDKGVNYLKPMILRDVADSIGVHESTVSRATSNKYMHTPQGIFELKFFFSTGLAGSDGQDIATEAIKNKVKSLINSEDPKKPLSDQKIVELLEDQGINVARRTVAKYREMLGILSSSKRKKLF